MALRALNPKLEVGEGEGFVQIHDSQDGTGILVELNDTSGAITVPYWHSEDADRVLSLIGIYLKSIHESAGFLAYDPQSECLLDPLNYNGPSLSLYAVGVESILGQPQKPWWKFW